MGWWRAERGGHELALGDAPYDIAMAALAQIADEYQRAHGRRPSLAEVIETLEVTLATGLDAYVSEAEGIELVRLDAKIKKRRSQQGYRVGDFLAIPLAGGLYAFGRILSDLRADEMGMLVGIYAEISKRLHHLAQLKGGNFMFTPFYCTDEGWKTWRWKIIGNAPLEEGEFTYPRHKEGMKGMGWSIRDGLRVYPATEEEVQNLEYAKLWPMTAVENRIARYVPQLPGSSGPAP